MNNRSAAVIFGVTLILLGLFFLLNNYVNFPWPIFFLGYGLYWLASSFTRRSEDRAISALVIITLGGILTYQQITGDWESWYYLWPLVFAAVGAGMLLGPMVGRTHRPGGKYSRTAWSMFLLGLLTTAGLWYFRALLDWPSILVGIGGFFLMLALASGVGPFAIPGTTIGGIGLLLAYQNATGNWESWAFAWTLIPGFVGLGLTLAFLHSRTMRAIGLLMLGWSLVVFVFFGALFPQDGDYTQYWPLALVLAGLVVLGQNMLIQRRKNSLNGSM